MSTDPTPAYVPLTIDPDPARDARVAARRAADAARAGRALDRLLAYSSGWGHGYAASEEHHNRHYGVPGWPENGCPRTGCERFHSGVPHTHNTPASPCADGCSDPAAHAEGGHDV